MDMVEEKDQISDDFMDIEKKSKNNYIIIVSILYVLVIILSIILVLGIKHQKDTIKNNNLSDNITNGKASKNTKK